MLAADIMTDAEGKARAEDGRFAGWGWRELGRCFGERGSLTMWRFAVWDTAPVQAGRYRAKLRYPEAPKLRSSWQLHAFIAGVQKETTRRKTKLRTRDTMLSWLFRVMQLLNDFLNANLDTAGSRNCGSANFDTPSVP